MELVADSLACDRGGRNVFTDLSFSVSAGEALTVTGRNGAGKSSLLRIIAGLLRATSGSVLLTGGQRDLSLAEQAHYVGHQDACKPALTVAENLEFWSCYLGGKIRSNALDAVGLNALADLPAAYLSAGQKRRLALARLIAVRRPVWLLDEPTSALDTAAQKMLAASMKTHLKSGGLIVAAAHGPIGLSRARQLRLGGA
ncbi:MAG: heme ABC exporter ATP-binding protein CcmA [Pseudolabrys sp.]|nr:heme ABC exporter ATP-binding protein CcmA [Pseudolabrys sp.]MBV9261125.1 heme ABC exporter ATP-binding protein CcmA [Pseudolabrys sp.]